MGIVDGDKDRVRVASASGTRSDDAGVSTVSEETTNETSVPKESRTESGDQQVRGPQQTHRSAYPVSTLVVVAVIAFLVGSLLRSLISPADFIYVGEAAPQAEGGGGWRELRRLFEVKYVFGGWDLQVAAVRRHER